MPRAAFVTALIIVLCIGFTAVPDACTITNTVSYSADTLAEGVVEFTESWSGTYSVTTVETLYQDGFMDTVRALIDGSDNVFVGTIIDVHGPGVLFPPDSILQLDYTDLFELYLMMDDEAGCENVVVRVDSVMKGRTFDGAEFIYYHELAYGGGDCHFDTESLIGYSFLGAYNGGHVDSLRGSVIPSGYQGYLSEPTGYVVVRDGAGRYLYDHGAFPGLRLPLDDVYGMAGVGVPFRPSHGAVPVAYPAGSYTLSGTRAGGTAYRGIRIDVKTDGSLRKCVVLE